LNSVQALKPGATNHLGYGKGRYSSIDVVAIHGIAEISVEKRSSHDPGECNSANEPAVSEYAKDKRVSPRARFGIGHDRCALAFDGEPGVIA
jgi:hypothetical protein